MNAIIIARVSTEDQKSGPAQLERLRRYCGQKGFQVIREFDYDESAYKQRRSEFDAILRQIEASKSVIAVCFDKVDRLSRNTFDVRVAKLYERAVANEIELHFASDGQVINGSISAVEKFQFGMSLGLAKYYSDAISDNVRRRFEHKRAQGEIVGPAPFGYQSLHIDRERRLRSDVVIDPARAPYVAEMFERYAIGDTSIAKLTQDMNARGVTTVRGGKLWPSFVQGVLRNPFYCGVAISKKYKLRYRHRYSTLVSRDLWDRVQARMDGRNLNPTHSIRTREFLFRTILKPCPRCGCSITAQKKREKHVYYSCSNSKGTCKRLYVNEQVLLEAVQKVLAKIKFENAEIERIESFLADRFRDNARYHRERLCKAQAEMRALQAAGHRLLDLLLNQTIDENVFDEKHADIEAKKTKLQAEIATLSDADRGYVDYAKIVLLILRDAASHFECSNIAEKRAIIRIIFENMSLDGKTLNYSLRSPFDVLFGTERSSLLRRLDELRTSDWADLVGQFEREGDALGPSSTLGGIIRHRLGQLRVHAPGATLLPPARQ